MIMMMLLKICCPGQWRQKRVCHLTPSQVAVVPSHSLAFCDNQKQAALRQLHKIINQTKREMKKKNDYFSNQSTRIRYTERDLIKLQHS